MQLADIVCCCRQKTYVFVWGDVLQKPFFPLELFGKKNKNSYFIQNLWDLFFGKMHSFKNYHWFNEDSW